MDIQNIVSPEVNSHYRMSSLDHERWIISKYGLNVQGIQMRVGHLVCPIIEHDNANRTGSGDDMFGRGLPKVDEDELGGRGIVAHRCGVVA
jgi:hypothetical protein